MGGWPGEGVRDSCWDDACVLISYEELSYAGLVPKGGTNNVVGTGCGGSGIGDDGDPRDVIVEGFVEELCFLVEAKVAFMISPSDLLSWGKDNCGGISEIEDDVGYPDCKTIGW